MSLAGGAAAGGALAAFEDHVIGDSYGPGAESARLMTLLAVPIASAGLFAASHGKAKATSEALRSAALVGPIAATAGASVYYINN